MLIIKVKVETIYDPCDILKEYPFLADYNFKQGNDAEKGYIFISSLDQLCDISEKAEMDVLFNSVDRNNIPTLTLR